MKKSTRVSARRAAVLLGAVLLFAGAAKAERFTDVTATAFKPAFVHAPPTLDIFPAIAICGFDANGIIFPPGDGTCEPTSLSWIGGIAIADFDGDGYNDIFATSGAGGANGLYINNGDMTFTDQAAAAGVAFPANESVAAVAGDIDNDGDIDLYIANMGLGPQFNDIDGAIAQDFDFDEPGLNQLLLNNGWDENGKWLGFTLADAGAEGTPFALSQQPSLVDYDGDGDLDIYLATHNPFNNPLFPSDSPFYPYKRVTDQACLADGDGSDCEPTAIPQLLHNNLVEDGSLSFSDATQLLRDAEDGAGSVARGEDGRPINDSRFNFDAVWADYNNDGRPDIYQANDLNTPGLVVNTEDGFRYNASATGQAGLVGAWMGMAPGDIDGDGDIDFAATNSGSSVAGIVAFPFYGLFLNSGGPGPFVGFAPFVEVAAQVAQNAHGGSFANPSHDGDTSGDFGWGIQMADVDNDTDLDIMLMGNWFPVGFGIIGGETGGDPFTLPPGTPPIFKGHVNRGHLFENLGNDAETGLPILKDRSESAADRAELGIDNPRDSRGMAFADMDNDGDLDLVTLNVSGEATTGLAPGFVRIGKYTGGLRLYRNNGNGNRSITLRLKGVESNANGIGARVTVEAGGVTQVRELWSNVGHFAGLPPELVIGLGDAGTVASITIDWPSGTHQVVTGIPLKGAQHAIVEIKEAAGKSSYAGTVHNKRP